MDIDSCVSSVRLRIYYINLVGSGGAKKSETPALVKRRSGICKSRHYKKVSGASLGKSALSDNEHRCA